jgi:cytochrome P450 family 307 subfamily A
MFVIFIYFTANLAYIALGYIAKHPEIGRKIQEETSITTNNGERGVTLYDIDNMPYSQATVLEILRHSSSPIVPHVATENSQISGYGIPKDTIVFINNYELNVNEKLWDKPKEFIPERFLERVPAQKVKKDVPLDAPDLIRVKKNIPHFLPFSVGKRTCIGQNLVRSYTFLLLTHILQHFDITTDDKDSIQLKTACIALPPDTFQLRLTPRT